METPSKTELWDIIDPIVRAQGVGLFDMDVPKGPMGVLRVFLTGPAGVGIDDCARVSKRLSEWMDEKGYSDGWELEVSSPGVSRRLTRPEHFAGAVGERLKLKLVEGGTKFGVLRGFDGKSLEIEQEASEGVSSGVFTVALEGVREAKVDFDFGGAKNRDCRSCN